MAVVLFKSQIDDPTLWNTELSRYLAHLDFRVWPDVGDPQEVEYFLIWGELGDLLETLPNVKVILSLGAGVEHLGDLNKIQDNISIIRLVDDDLTRGMSEYVIFNVLRFHRLDQLYREQQSQRIWQEHPPVASSEIRVGVMGLGILGKDAAKKLSTLDYNVLGWCREPKTFEFCSVFHGKEGLDDFLKQTNILICLLPLTAETDGIFCARSFSKLPVNSYLVNAARGQHRINGDLLDALSSGQLLGAAIDVFQEEPLSTSHPFWGNTKIMMTPHVASKTNYKTAAKCIARNINNWERGGNLEGVVNSSRGY